MPQSSGRGPLNRARSAVAGPIGVNAVTTESILAVEGTGGLQSEQPATCPLDLCEGTRTNDRAAELVLKSATVFSGLIVGLVAFFVLQKGLPALFNNGWGFVTSGGWDIDLQRSWADPAFASFGVRPLIAGTVFTTLFALLVTVIIGTGCAVVIAELAPPSVRRPLETVVQLLAGVPSVVFGLIGFSVVVPFVEQHIVPADAWEAVPEIPYMGQSMLAAIIVLTFMIMPFYVSVAVDSLRAVPRSLVQGARALGLTQWRAVSKVQLPIALPGLMAGAMLASARAIGEAIALSMVAGALAFTPGIEHGPLFFFLTPIRTMASAIVETGAEAISIEAIESALFGIAALLLIATLVLSLLARAAFAWSAKRLNLSTERAV